MIKKIISGLCFFIIAISPSLADSAPITDKEIKEIEQFFNSYINSANTYKNNFIDHYSKDAVIERVVIKPDGTKQTVSIPMKRYIKELKLGRKTAKLIRYKNFYTNKKYEKIGENEYKITSMRIPFKDKKGLNAEFKVIKTPNGYKISEEKMETNVQRFLSEK